VPAFPHSFPRRSVDVRGPRFAARLNAAFGVCLGCLLDLRYLTFTYHEKEVTV